MIKDILSTVKYNHQQIQDLYFPLQKKIPQNLTEMAPRYSLTLHPSIKRFGFPYNEETLKSKVRQHFEDTLSKFQTSQLWNKRPEMVGGLVNQDATLEKLVALTIFSITSIFLFIVQGNVLIKVEGTFAKLFSIN